MRTITIHRDGPMGRDVPVEVGAVYLGHRNSRASYYVVVGLGHAWRNVLSLGIDDAGRIISVTADPDYYVSGHRTRVGRVEIGEVRFRFEPETTTPYEGRIVFG